MTTRMEGPGPCRPGDRAPLGRSGRSSGHPQRRSPAAGRAPARSNDSPARRRSRPFAAAETVERRISIVGGDRQQRGEYRRHSFDVAIGGGDRCLQACQRQRGSILAIEAERELELLGEGIKRRTGVVGRALKRDRIHGCSPAIRSRSSWTIRDLPNSGLSRQQHDLAVTAPLPAASARAAAQFPPHG